MSCCPVSGPVPDKGCPFLQVEFGFRIPSLVLLKWSADCRFIVHALSALCSNFVDSEQTRAKSERGAVAAAELLPAIRWVTDGVVGALATAAPWHLHRIRHEKLRAGTFAAIQLSAPSAERLAVNMPPTSSAAHAGGGFDATLQRARRVQAGETLRIPNASLLRPISIACSR